VSREDGTVDGADLDGADLDGSRVDGGEPGGAAGQALRVVRAQTPLQVEAAYDVRTTVFVDEQGVPPELEMDAADDRADHVLAMRGTRPVGAARLVVEPCGFAGVDPAQGEVGHLGRLAVQADERGRGAGAALAHAVEDAARGRGLAVLVLAAQTHALGFYERLGYRAYGDEFDDAGLPHRMMRKDL